MISELVKLSNVHAYDGTSTPIRVRLKELLGDTQYANLAKLYGQRKQNDDNVTISAT